ncbi:MAG: hypothetical protein CM15mP116_11350 [Synechococcus sp.]|nr:MAG: hypothetical protein CM15mP116_11350 [Synechococcus sp.]
MQQQPLVSAKMLDGIPKSSNTTAPPDRLWSLEEKKERGGYWVKKHDETNQKNSRMDRRPFPLGLGALSNSDSRLNAFVGAGVWWTGGPRNQDRTDAAKIWGKLRDQGLGKIAPRRNPLGTKTHIFENSALHSGCLSPHRWAAPPAVFFLGKKNPGWKRFTLNRLVSLAFGVRPLLGKGPGGDAAPSGVNPPGSVCLANGGGSASGPSSPSSGETSMALCPSIRRPSNRLGGARRE